MVTPALQRDMIIERENKTQGENVRLSADQICSGWRYAAAKQISAHPVPRPFRIAKAAPRLAPEEAPKCPGTTADYETSW